MLSSGRLSVVYLEDSEADAELARRLLRRAFPGLGLRHVPDEAGFRRILAERPPADLILSDYALPGFGGREALAIAQELQPGTPLIFLSGTIGEEIAIEMLKLGAIDYVLKHRMSRLVPAVQRALREAEARRDRAALARRLDAERRLLEAILNAVPDTIYALDRDGVITAANRSAQALFGVADPQRLVGRRLESTEPRAGDAREIAAEDRALMASGRTIEDDERNWQGIDGRERRVAVSKLPLRDHDGTGIEGLACVIRDVTERRLLERALLESSEHEQRRIGGDLHDGLGQELTGLDFMLKALESALTRDASPHLEALARSREVLRRALTDTRRLARGLAPVGLEYSELPDALSGLIRDCADRFSIDCRFDNALPQGFGVDRSRAIHVYRIVQEAIANAARHGGARRVTTRLAAKGELTIEIADDGRGFDPSVAGDPSRAGMGLRLMRYRASLIGGRIAIASGPQGTRITCHCPGTRVRRSAHAQRP